MKAARSTLKRLKCADYALSLETSLADGDSYHPHTHLLLESAPSGRNYISNENLQDAWLTELPQWMHPQMAAAEIETVRDLEAVCSYNTKSPFTGTGGQTTVGRMIDSLFALKGMKRFERHGSMKFGEWTGHPFADIGMQRAA
jgi:hypothetical protein